MAHEEFELCVMRVPPQKTENDFEFSACRLNATANGNRTEADEKEKFVKFLHCCFVRDVFIF
jgi:hypothetical protein